MVLYDVVRTGIPSPYLSSDLTGTLRGAVERCSLRGPAGNSLALNSYCAGQALTEGITPLLLCIIRGQPLSCIKAAPADTCGVCYGLHLTQNVLATRLPHTGPGMREFVSGGGENFAPRTSVGVYILPAETKCCNMAP